MHKPLQEKNYVLTYFNYLEAKLPSWDTESFQGKFQDKITLFVEKYKKGQWYKKLIRTLHVIKIEQRESLLIICIKEGILKTRNILKTRYIIIIQ